MHQVHCMGQVWSQTQSRPLENHLPSFLPFTMSDHKCIHICLSSEADPILARGTKRFVHEVQVLCDKFRHVL